MNENLLSVEPRMLWKNFRELTLIPRPSGHEERAAMFLLEFGQRHADEALRDQAGNVIWRKKATPGMEGRKSIALQAHIDMVPQKDSGKEHDFVCDPISTIVDGGFVMASGTTLGADDGIGAAAIMAIFESPDIQHGPLEALFTIDEETGLTGAANLKPGTLRSKILINLDSEEHGIFYIGCAGGVNVRIAKKMGYGYQCDGAYAYFRLQASGFKGGHSGCDIHKNRPNPVKLIFRLLNTIIGQYDFHLGDFGGGDMHNAIPREAFAEVAVFKTYAGDFAKAVSDFQKTVEDEYGLSDPGCRIEASECEPFRFFSTQSRNEANYIVNTLTSGVFAMSARMPALVETSNNLSVLKVSGDELKIQCLLRSSVKSQSDYLKQIMKMQMNFCGASCEFEGEYPGWNPDPGSEILEICKETFKKQFAQEPQVAAIHAGLECGMIIDKHPGMDAISLGPNVYGAHTPGERVEIDSTQKFMSLLTGILTSAPLEAGHTTSKS